MQHQVARGVVGTLLWGGALVGALGCDREPPAPAAMESVVASPERVVAAPRAPVVSATPVVSAAPVVSRAPSASALSDAPPSLRVADLHVDLSYQYNYKHEPFATATGQVPADQLLAAGVRTLVLPLFVPRDVAEGGPRASDLEASYERLLTELGRTPPYAVPSCRRVPGTVQTILSFEGAAPLAGHPERVAVWTGRGLRIFGFVHTEDNALASSAGKGPVFVEPSFGLTPAGVELAKAVFHERAVVDISHASDRAALALLDLADAHGGVDVATHSNARALAAHPRNLSDELIRRIAKTGGVVGVNFHSPFLRRDGNRATLADVVRHVQHIVALVGVEHVAIGSDFEGGITAAEELGDVRGFATLAAALARAGFSAVDVDRVLFLNAFTAACPR